VVVPHETVNKY